MGITVFLMTTHIIAINEIIIDNATACSSENFPLYRYLLNVIIFSFSMETPQI